ncbi:hypothetical protein JRO89_XS02G0258000 [Xanthoceras sorbifolium]|uniref:Uncharacterized protein n=1 Tax=Xanthoceras sorbifolium TaxID=99658 RepID=A0ABQ8IGZ9_9ROSI|nr:hypothetical protein JRO89_XS02G0258000 [Xanthoceras sorbifolium]
MLGTIVFTYFIKKSVIKPEAQQLIMVDIVFPGLQLIISCYCLIRTLSGVKTKYSSSVFPIAYTIISVVFKFKKTNDVLHPSSDTPPGPLSNQSATIVKDTDKSNTPVDQIASDSSTLSRQCKKQPKAYSDDGDDTNPSNPTVDSMPKRVASDSSTLSRQHKKQSKAYSDDEDDTNPSISNLDSKTTSVTNDYSKRRKQLESYKDNVDDTNPLNSIDFLLRSSHEYATVRRSRKQHEETEMDPVAIVSKLRKLCYAEIVSVGPEKEPEKIEEEQVYKDL